MRKFGKTFDNFMTCIRWAAEGKTFIFVDPKFVAIDMKTWDKIQHELHPPIERQVIYDECSDWTPETEARLKELFEKRLARRVK